ncbi:MAG: hypothetical protein SynsKO_14240 [Synoicihabitans sp.]
MGTLNPSKSIAWHIEQRVKTHPDRVALQVPAQDYSYAEVDRVANAVARRIHQQANQSNPRVMIWLQDPLQETTGVLATWKAGGAFVPLDAQAPFEFNLEIIHLVKPAVILVDRHVFVQLMAHAPDQAESVFCWDEVDLSLEHEALSVSTPPEALARIVFTSGSTGKPKGVIHDHQGMLHRAATSIAGADFQAGDCQLNLSPLSHVTGSTVLLNTLLIGGTVSCYPLRQHGVGAMAAWIESKQVTRLATVPTVFRRFLQSPQLETSQLQSVRTVYLGADSTRWDDVALFRRFFPPETNLICNIGSTETGPIVRYFVPADAEITAGTVPLGLPYPDIELELRDEEGAIVGPGEVGEIVVRSRGIACGYFNDSEKTAERFYRDPQDPALRTFKTGDMARFDDDQRLIYAGRRDRMIKVKGHRVELDNIAAILRKHPAIAEADVRIWTDSSVEPQMAAYFVTRDSTTLEVPSLLRWLLEQLPRYMVPPHLIPLDGLPLHSSGKINRQALPKPLSLPSDPTLETLNDDPTKSAVLELWRRLLKRPTLQPDDNYFAMGGDSLLAVQLLLEAADITGHELPQHVLFRAPTARQFARAIQEPHARASNLISIRSSGSKAPIFWVHGRADSLFLIVNVARNLDPDRPTFLIECNEQSGKSARPASVDELVIQYADLIEEQVPTGPCVLGGFSLGGTFAFAVAAELLRRNRKILTVVVIDRHPINLPTFIKFRMMAPDLLWRVRSQVGDILRGQRELNADYFRTLWSRISDRLRLQPTALEKGPESSTESAEREVDYYANLSFHYRPSPVPLPVFLIQSKSTHFNLEAAWKYLSQGRVTRVWVASAHQRIIEPPNSTLVNTLIRQHLAPLE